MQYTTEELSAILSKHSQNVIDLSAIIERAEDQAERQAEAEERRRILARAEVATRRFWQTCLMDGTD